MIREIVVIDDEKCNGCGECIPACAEGALRIENGKARLVADRLCDGMAACLGHCPQGAIRVERREADVFDEAAVAAAAAAQAAQAAKLRTVAHENHEGGCPGTRARALRTLPTVPNGYPTGTPRAEAVPGALTQELPIDAQPSELGSWPVKLRLMGPRAPFLANSRLLVAADCAAFACGDFHSRFLRGRIPVMACPKLEDMAEHTERLIQILSHNTIQEIAVVRMLVPCCAGIVTAVRTAAARTRFPGLVTEITAGLEGQIVHERSYRIAEEQNLG